MNLKVFSKGKISLLLQRGQHIRESYLQCIRVIPSVGSARNLNKNETELDFKFDNGGVPAKFEICQSLVLPSLVSPAIFTDVLLGDTLTSGALLFFLSGTLWDLHRRFLYRQISWHEFVNEYLEQGKVERIEIINRRRVRIKPVPGTTLDGRKTPWFAIGSVDSFERNFRAAQTSGKALELAQIPYVYRHGVDVTSISGFFVYLLMTTLTAGLALVISLSGEEESERERSPLSAKGDFDTYARFEKIVGHEKVKDQLLDFAYLLTNPEECSKLVVYNVFPRALLTGPPGTGKTALISSLAQEANVIPVNGHSLMKYYLESPSTLAEVIKNVFNLAHARGSCILFIDEIDALIPLKGETAPESKAFALNELVVQMGNLEFSKVILVAATNQIDKLPDSLLRKFCHMIPVPLPNLKERAAIFNSHFRYMKTAAGWNDEQLAHELAKQTEGLSGRDIWTVCVQAGLTAARGNERESIEWSDFESALQRVQRGRAAVAKATDDRTQGKSWWSIIY